MVKNLPVSAADISDVGQILGSGRSPGQEDPLEEGMATHPVFLPAESHGQRSLTVYHPEDHKKSYMTEAA